MYFVSSRRLKNVLSYTYNRKGVSIFNHHNSIKEGVYMAEKKKTDVYKRQGVYLYLTPDAVSSGDHTNLQ